jgi:hypothetical protein
MELALMVGEPDHVNLLLSNGGIINTKCMEYLKRELIGGNCSPEIQEILKSISTDNFASCHLTALGPLPSYIYSLDPSIAP